MAEVTMSEMTVPKMAVAMAAVMAVAAMTTVAVATGKSLTRDGERGSGQRQRRRSGENRVLDRAHERLRVGQRGDRSAMLQPRRAERDTM